MNVGELLRRLVQSCRTDGLGSISTASGSSLVRMGETTVVTGIKAEIAEPSLAAPDEGYLGTFCE